MAYLSFFRKGSPTCEVKVLCPALAVVDRAVLLVVAHVVNQGVALVVAQVLDQGVALVAAQFIKTISNIVRGLLVDNVQHVQVKDRAPAFLA
eukprot:5789487-Heterocapsa_arctica.AAC.1